MTKAQILLGLDRLIASHEPCSSTHHCSVIAELRNLTNAIRRQTGNGRKIRKNRRQELVIGRGTKLCNKCCQIQANCRCGKRAKIGTQDRSTS